MILREMPDLPPRPLTRSNAAFRAHFYARWGNENAIVMGRSRRVEYAPLKQTLSIKTARAGTETYTIGTRRLCVDDDSYLILNEGQTYSSVLQGDHEADSFCVFFRPKMADEVLGALSASPAQAADNGAQCPLRKAQFAENLRTHDEVVTPALLQLARTVRDGTDDADEIEEALQDLLRRIFCVDHRLRDVERSIAAIKASTRAELLKRVNLAADFICSNYSAPVSLDDIAAAATLSKFHLVRLFRQVHRVGPHRFLINKRLAAARRLLDRRELDLDEVAALAGFGTRWSLFRHLQRTAGQGGTSLRKTNRTASGVR